VNSPDPATYTDLHSHLIPGVDDGARTQEEAMEAIQRLWDEGVRTVATTPHLEGSLTKMPEALERRLHEVDLAWEALKAEASRLHPEMEFHRGHEVMLDVPDPDFSDPRTRLAGTPTVLVEWPRLQVPPATPQVLARIRDAGYKVVLAHPERYHGLNAGLDLPGEWRRMGALLQVNYGSLVGRYGEEPRKRALTFLERGWVDLFSTDFHARSHLSIYLSRAREAMELLDGSEQFELLARTNPQRVLKGDDPLPALPLVQKRGVWEKLRELFSGHERR
jgi:protein-tyrosine phosphatase